MQESLLQYLLLTHSIDIIADDFNYDLSEVWENKLWDIFTDQGQVVNMTTHRSGSWINDAYIKKTLMLEFSTDSIVENIYFQDHAAVRTVVERNNLDFHTVP